MHNPGDEGTGRAGTDFIRAIVAEDQRAGRHGGRVVTRFPPEPNGYLHIGHAKSICLNFGIAEENPGGRCHLRFDDTNPETEDVRYVESIREDVRWLGFDWGEHLYYASDYFDEMYRLAEWLIERHLAYVDSSTEEEIREGRGTVTVPGTASRYRERSIQENLDLFRRIRAGEFPNGAHVLRARIDMASPNMLMRDPLLYRIRHAHHYRTGDSWCLYPLYDYAHPVEDAIECVTHSICTLEFENNRELYDWVVEGWRGFRQAAGETPCRPRQYEFARLNLDFTVMSKRKLLELVRDGSVSGWDDPRMPTIAGLRRRGVTPESIRAFCDLIGVARADSRVDIGKLEYTIRDDLNQRVPRVLCVLRPLRVVLTNWPADRVEELDAPCFPHDVPKEGTRPLPFSGELYIDRDDFMETPTKGYHRLSPGAEVRLRHGYIIRCEEVVKDGTGEIVELRCSYDPLTRGGQASAGRTVKGTIQWVSAAHSLPCEVRLYDRLFTTPVPDAGPEDFREYLNPESLVVLTGARIEPGVAADPAGSQYQFERVGFFCSDPVDSRPDALVFNRTVTLRDTWARKSGETPAADPASRPQRRKAEGVGPVPDLVGAPERARPAAERSPELDEKRRRYVAELGLSAEEADILSREAPTAAFFDAAFGGAASARGVANWVINELPRAAGSRDLTALPFGGPALGRLVALIEDGAVTSSAGREVLAEMVATGADPDAIVEGRGLRQVSDPGVLRPLVEEVVASHAAKATEYRNGRAGLLGFFVGQVMGRTGGRANPELVRRMLEEHLSTLPSTNP